MSPLSENVLSVDEIFLSIQGESSASGFLCVFVRLFGCNIGCTYCDQPQVKEDRHRMKISEVVSKVASFGVKNVCITGGEPLMQWNAVLPLVLELQGYRCTVSIETSGCYPIDNDECYNRSYNYIMDVKCPSSGVANKNILNNILFLKPKDEIKFVVSNREDYDYMLQVMRKYPTNSKLLISPCFTTDLKPMIGKELVEWMTEDRLHDFRIQIQLHKILGVL